ncbi:hypothetical protein JZ785_10040 [Alicyclobacillus curvatus]|nr:hypothetical protein JZ785_10040 [Alicyclobacillus curvatus]
MSHTLVQMIDKNIPAYFNTDECPDNFNNPAVRAAVTGSTVPRNGSNGKCWS